MTKIVVVGSRGFIGRPIFEELNRQSSVSVRGIESRMDLALEKERSDGCFHDCDIIIWCASKVNPRIAFEQKSLVSQEISEWESFLDYFTFRRDAKIVFFSSGGAIYSETSMVSYKEADAAEGFGSYGVMKSKMEKLLSIRSENYLILRPSNVSGSAQKTGIGQGVINEWARSILNKSQVVLFGSDESVRDFLFIDDLVDFFSVQSNLELSGIYNLGSGVGTSMRSLIEEFKKIHPFKFDVVNIGTRDFDRKSVILNIDKVTQDTNWFPRHSIQSIVSNIYRDARNE